MKGSLEHVAAVATTMDQTGGVLHFVEVRIINPMLHPVLSLTKIRCNIKRPYGNHSRRLSEALFVTSLLDKPSLSTGLTAVQRKMHISFCHYLDVGKHGKRLRLKSSL